MDGEVDICADQGVLLGSFSRAAAGLRSGLAAGSTDPTLATGAAQSTTLAAALASGALFDLHQLASRHNDAQALVLADGPGRECRQLRREADGLIDANREHLPQLRQQHLQLRGCLWRR